MTKAIERANTVAKSDSGVFPIHITLGCSIAEKRARFDELVSLNPEICVEQTASGEIVMMLPTGGNSGRRSMKCSQRLSEWAEQNGGQAFDSSTLFQLPNGARRGPDCSWVTQMRWDALSEEERDGYPPLAPDFVVELRSNSDRISELKKKMIEYQENGVKFGWLIDPLHGMVYVYGPVGDCVELVDPISVNGEQILLGFELKLADVFS